MLGLSALLSIPSTSIATNGIYLIGFGAKSRSMGGVGIGYTQDSIGNAMNPAGISAVADDVDAMRFDMGAMLFRPIRGASIPDGRDCPNCGNDIFYKSESNLFVIPSMGAVYKFNRKLTLGFSGVGAGGGGTRYEKLAPNGYNFFNPVGRTDVGDTLGVNYLQAQMALTAAYKVNKRNTIAISPVFGLAQFRAFGLGVFKPFSSDPDNMTNRGNDYSYGAGVRLGWQGKVHDRLTLGATYASKIYMTKFDKYKGLFAGHGSMDAPANYGLGLAFDVTDKLVLAFDWQRVLYSDVAAISNPIENLANPDGFLGENKGAGFGWDDQDIYKFGMKYKYNENWDFALGFNYAKAPMPNDQLLFSAVAPAVTEKHITTGATYKPNRNMEWTLTYVHAFKNTIKGKANSGGQFDLFYPNTDPNKDGPGDMDLQMKQDSLEIEFSYKL